MLAEACRLSVGKPGLLLITEWIIIFTFPIPSKIVQTYDKGQSTMLQKSNNNNNNKKM